MTISYASSGASPIADPLISPDERLLLRLVVADPLGHALLINDLNHPEDPPRLVGRGTKAELLSFVTPTRVLGSAYGTNQAELLALDGAEVARAACSMAPVVSPDGTRLATITTDGHVVLLDPSSLRQQWRLESPVIPAAAAELTLTFRTKDLLVVSHDAGALVLDVAAKIVRYDAASTNGTAGIPALSLSGRYIGSAAYSTSAEAWTVSILDTTTGKPTSVSEQGMALPMIAFSHDEDTAVVSTSPSMITTIRLADGKIRHIRTGIDWSNEGYGYVTNKLALTEDGRYVCGHPATTIGKYTNCANQVYADLNLAPRKPSALSCFIDGETAYVAPWPHGVERDGRKALTTSSATYTQTCNELLSPDHKTLGLVTAKLDALGQTYLDAEMSLVDVPTGKVTQRLPLGTGPAGMGEILWSQYSPNGRWLRIRFGEQTSLFDAATGRAFAFPPGATGDLTFSPNESFAVQKTSDALCLIARADGALRCLPDRVGSFCLEAGGRLGPVDQCGVVLLPTASASANLHR